MNNVNMIIENNAVSNHPELFRMGRKALVVTGRSSAKKCGALDDVLSVLEKENIEYTIFDEIEQNPTISSCMEAGNKGRDCDFVIGIGGGSPLDATKAIAIFIPNPNLSEDDFYGKKWENKPLEFILIGTTAGTGSEVTKVSVLTDSKGIKHSQNDNVMYAKTAIGDPKYTLSLNREFTISTGIDAICHATESWFSNKANDESRIHSVKAIHYLYDDLLSLIDSKISLSLSQRTNLYRGSIEAGYAIAITGTTFGHNLGYYLTEHYHLPHGLACAAFLNDVIDWQLQNNSEYAKRFFQSIGMKPEDFKKLLRLLPDNDVVMTEEQIEKILPRWENNGSVKNTYGTMTIDDVHNILFKNFIK